MRGAVRPVPARAPLLSSASPASASASHHVAIIDVIMATRVSRGAAPLPLPAQRALLAALAAPAGAAAASQGTPGRPHTRPEDALNQWRRLREAALATASARPTPEALAWAAEVYLEAHAYCRDHGLLDELWRCQTPLLEVILPRLLRASTRAEDADRVRADLRTVRTARLLVAAASAGAPVHGVTESLRALVLADDAEPWVRDAVVALLAGNAAAVDRLRRTAPPDVRPWLRLALVALRPRTLAAAAAAFHSLPVPLLCAWTALADDATGRGELQAWLDVHAPRAAFSPDGTALVFRPRPAPAAGPRGPVVTPVR